MAVSTQLFEMIDATVEGLGYELVDVEKLPRGLIRVTIDKDGGITLDDCEKVSNQLNNAMTVENVDYDRLEVSSPGVDRPLKRPRDFVKFVGQNVHVELFAQSILLKALLHAGQLVADNGGFPSGKVMKIPYVRIFAPKVAQQQLTRQRRQRGLLRGIQKKSEAKRS